jgi:SPP1 family phage portal protein
MRYYYIDEVEGEQAEQLIRIEFYDENTVTYYIQKRLGNKQLVFQMDDSEKENPQPHGFQKVPLIPYPNNAEFVGDAERVVEMIDAYDRQVSNLDSEMEQLRLAYMKFVGAGVQPETFKNAVKTGLFALPQGADASFIEKNLATEPIERHLERLRRDIISVAQSVDTAELQAKSQLSGVAIAMMYTALENSCSFTEQKFKKSTKQLLECYNTALGVQPIIIENLDMQFTRNLPTNLVEVVDMVVKLKGMVSDETLLNQLPFIDDAQWEIDKLNEQAQSSVNFDDVELDDDTEADTEAGTEVE